MVITPWPGGKWEKHMKFCRGCVELSETGLSFGWFVCYMYHVTVRSLIFQTFLVLTTNGLWQVSPRSSSLSGYVSVPDCGCGHNAIFFHRHSETTN